MNIGDKVRIIVGNNKGTEGIFLGKQNNSNWYVVKAAQDAIFFVNLDELEDIETIIDKEVEDETDVIVSLEDAEVQEDIIEDLPIAPEKVTSKKSKNKKHRK